MYNFSFGRWAALNAEIYPTFRHAVQLPSSGRMYTGWTLHSYSIISLRCTICWHANISQSRHSTAKMSEECAIQNPSAFLSADFLSTISFVFSPPWEFSERRSFLTLTLDSFDAGSIHRKVILVIHRTKKTANIRTLSGSKPPSTLWTYGLWTWMLSPLTEWDQQIQTG